MATLHLAVLSPRQQSVLRDPDVAGWLAAAAEQGTELADRHGALEAMDDAAHEAALW